MARILLALALLRLSITNDYWGLIFAIAWAVWELLKLDDQLYKTRRRENENKNRNHASN